MIGLNSKTFLKTLLPKAGDGSSREYIEALRQELVDCVEKEMSPIALRYRYASTPLEANIKWRPLVLILGNYSSGKSTFINELLGLDVQKTGQAPTDDCFTVITSAIPGVGHAPGRVDERDGNALINDGQYPFEALRRHGQRFASHFRLKMVDSPFLANLALIDTPGMVDSVSERDRGYDYQEVIGDLAQIADLILVMFDPHKAGTIRETYESLRRTLPKATYEDRVLFVLNRIDECTNLSDLLRVYGTLCWNLSQMTGRKDIPMIYLSYSPGELKNAETREFLRLLENQREHLKRAILAAPTHRLDHLASYIEGHGERLSHYLEALVAYATERRNYIIRLGIRGIVLAIATLFLSYWGLYFLDSNRYNSAGNYLPVASVISLVTVVAWVYLGFRYLIPAYHRSLLKRLDQLTTKDWQRHKEVWEAIKPLVHDFLERSQGRIGLIQAKNDYALVKGVWQKVSREVRQAMNALLAQPSAKNPEL